MELSEHSSSPPADNPTCTDTENGKQYPEAAEEQETLAADEETQLSDTQSIDVGDSIDNDNNINKRKTSEGEGGGGKGGLHPLWKTSLCSFFRRQSGSCSHGDTCRYAHGEAELRRRPDKSWDPTSERAKKLLKSDSGERVEAVPEAREDVLLSVPQSDEADPSDTALSRCIVHLPQKWTSENLKSFLDTQRVLYKTAKKKKGMTVGFIGFEDAEQITNATEVLDGKSMGNKHLKVANVILRSHEKKPHIAMVPDRRIAQPTKKHSGNGDPSEDPSGLVENEDVVDEDDHEADGSATKVRSARDVVTPLAHMPYIDQLENKKNSLIQTLKRLTRNARKACPDAVPLPEWIHKSREIGGLPCKLEGILESPLVDGYRNKCEFSVGYSRQGKQTVGFMLGNFREGVTAVEEPVDCPNVSRISCKYASIFQEFLQSSPLPVWNRIDNTGFWRQLTVREGRSLDHSAEVENAKSSIAEVMLIVQVCSSGVNNELVTGEFQRMAKALAHGASTCSPPLPLTALVVQDHKGISNAAPSDSPLLPLTIPEVEDVSNLVDSNSVKTRIHDYISSLRFSISPTAFFQVNTLAAEKLYSLAGDWAGLDPDTLLFDICCGTGTIGLTLAHRVGMVVGIEMNASAVSDAQRNAEINGIKNCRFICAKAEDVMGSLLREYLSLPPQKDKTLHVSESESNKDIGDKDNVAHDDKVHSQDSFASNSDALVNDENVETKLDYSADRSNGSSEVAQLPMEAVDSLNAMEESTTETSMSNENSNHNMASTHIDAATLSENSNHKMASISIDASMPNVNLEQEMADVKSTQGGQQSSLAELKDPSENCISEENVSSPIPGRQFKNVVAIVDPPRVGLHPIVIKALRTHPRLRRLVYISCNPESLVANAIELCTPSPDKPDKGKNNRGWRNMSSAGLARHRTKSMPNSEPFRPVKAMAVDLFPHTPHCELVMLLDR